MAQNPEVCEKRATHFLLVLILLPLYLLFLFFAISLHFYFPKGSCKYVMYATGQSALLGMVIIGGERSAAKVNPGQSDLCYAF